MSRIAFLLVALTLLGCGAEPAPRRVCFVERADPSQPPRPNLWVKLLVTIELAKDGVLATRDCTGGPIAWVPPAQSCTIQSPILPIPHPVPVSEQSVFERKLPDADRRLIWIATHRFANGDGYGPIALTRLLPTGVEVEAIGALRLRTSRVNLELWRIGQESLVIASGESCERDDEPDACRRASAVLVMRDKQLIYQPILDASSSTCTDEAFVEQRRDESEPLGGGKLRKYNIVATLSHDERYLVINEQARITDLDPRVAGTPPVRRIDAQRFVHAREGRLISRQQPLWVRTLPSAGAMVDSRP